MELELSADEWCELFDAGRMGSALAQRAGDGDAPGLAVLHNTGRVDLFALVERACRPMFKTVACR